MRPELGPFLAKADAFLQAAEVLFSQGLYESCISRAYCAAFTSVSVLPTQKTARKVINLRTQRIEWNHNSVHTHFLHEFHRRSRVFTKQEVDCYSQLKIERENADYATGQLNPRRVERLLIRTRELLVKIRDMVENEKHS